MRPFIVVVVVVHGGRDGGRASLKSPADVADHCSGNSTLKLAAGPVLEQARYQRGWRLDVEGAEEKGPLSGPGRM